MVLTPLELLSEAVTGAVAIVAETVQEYDGRPLRGVCELIQGLKYGWISWDLRCHLGWLWMRLKTACWSRLAVPNWVCPRGWS